MGLQSEGKTGAVGHWLELAMQRGKSGSRKLRSWAVDAGLTWSLPFRGTPTLIAGYARGSGGGDARIDGKFRQTGLQDNEDRISGLGNVRCYGELLDPDLSNIQIATAGIGFPAVDTPMHGLIEGLAAGQRQRSSNDRGGEPYRPSASRRKIGSLCGEQMFALADLNNWLWAVMDFVRTVQGRCARPLMEAA